MNPARGCLAVGLIGARGKASVMHALLALPVINLVIAFQIAVAADQSCQRPVIFQYSGTAAWDNLNFQVPPNAANGPITQIKSNNITNLGYFQSDGTISLIKNETNVDASGRWLYNQPVDLIRPCTSNSVTSFSTMFEISIMPSPTASLPLEGVAFIIVPGEAGGYSGWLNITSNGLDHESVRETTVVVWIQYDGSNLTVLEAWYADDDGCSARDVFSGPMCKPTTPIFSKVVDLTNIINSSSVYVGFSGAIPYNNKNYRGYNNLSYNSPTYGYKINGWTFNSDGPTPDIHHTSIDYYGSTGKGYIVPLVATIPAIFVFLILVLTIYYLYRRNGRLTALAKKYEIEIGVLDRGPQIFKYKVLSTATKGFSSEELLGTGGFGSVYKGRLVFKGDEKPTDIAVKRISATSKQGPREFLAEVKVIGQVQHRNLVRLLGWCHEKGELLLVYDYMPNGSVDQHLFKGTEQEPILTWARRLKIVSGVATALAYLHEEWEQRVIHRDVKSSNVMLDRDFNARLGDFGLARLSAHDQAPQSTAVLAGTYGYLAPELAHSLKSTEKTDVYSFGAVVLEVATGKRPILSLEDQKIYSEILLVDWVWGLYKDNALLEAADPRLHKAYDPGEMIMFLKIGLLCSHPDPDVRPTMREVLNIWKGASPLPPLPHNKPVPIFISRVDGFGPDTTFTISTDPNDTSDGLRDTNSAMDSVGQSTPMETFAPGSSHRGRNPTLRYRRSNTITALPL